MSTQGSGPSRRWPPERVFPATTVLVLLISLPVWLVVLTAGLPPPDPIGTGAVWIGGLLIFAGFAWCEVVPVRVEVRRETMMVSLSEFPMVLGLLLLPWQVVLVTHLVAGAVVYLIRRDGWRHSTLNLALIMIETGAALGVMLLLARIFDVSPTGQLAVGLGVLAGALVSSLVVGVAYRFLGPAEPLHRVLNRAFSSAGFVIVFALVAAALWQAGAGGPILALALAVVCVIVYLIFRSMMSRHADLNQLYSFIRAVGTAQADNTRWPEMLELVRQQNNAAVAVLYLTNAQEWLDRRYPALITLAVDTDGRTRVPAVDPADPLLALAAERGIVRASLDREPSPKVIQALRQRKAKDVMIAALESNGVIRGFVEVRDRLSRWGRFSDEDSEFLSTLSGHMATALDNVRLLGTLRDAAYRDSVTGLRSRAGLTVDAEQALAEDRLGAVVLIQMDILSEVNNALGHRHGEELMAAAGARLSAFGPRPRTIGRLESDLFAVLVAPMGEQELVEEVRRLLAAVSPSYSLAGVDVEAEPHSGIALVGEDPAESRVDAATLLQRAEMALLAGRERGDRMDIYRTTMGEVYRRRFQLVTQFRQAIDSGHIEVYYQPKVTLRNQELRGVEALVRWVHPEFGMVNPGEFVKAIETTGSIDILLGHVLSTVLKQIQSWMRRGLHISVAVNLSMRNLTSPQFPQRVADALAEHGVPASLLTFELTESNVMGDPETALPVLDTLHGMGVRLSVDDFGTGYSSLAYLRRLPLDEIKIDRSFVLGMSTALGDLAIVQSIIDLGHSLGLQVVAEGVEEESSRETLRSMRCDGMQGFLLSRPQPVDRFEAWLAARTVRTTVEGSDEVSLRVVG